jgi:hypothetical protein
VSPADAFTGIAALVGLGAVVAALVMVTQEVRDRRPPAQLSFRRVPYPTFTPRPVPPNPTPDRRPGPTVRHDYEIRVRGTNAALTVVHAHTSAAQALDAYTKGDRAQARQLVAVRLIKAGA